MASTASRAAHSPDVIVVSTICIGINLISPNKAIAALKSGAMGTMASTPAVFMISSISAEIYEHQFPAFFT